MKIILSFFLVLFFNKSYAGTASIIKNECPESQESSGGDHSDTHGSGACSGTGHC